MRIGEFSKKHGVTIDTIRHYMDMELILADKRGEHYYFDEASEKDLSEILWFKNAGFSLSEIQKIFVLKRLRKLKSNEDIDYYKNLLISKRNELFDNKRKLDIKINQIDERINKIDYTEDIKEQRLGIPIVLMSQFICPKCCEPLILREGNIENNMIINGELCCNCGESIFIKDGIIIVQNRESNTKITGKSIATEEYIEKTAPEFINFLYKGIEWMIKKASLEPLEGKVMMEIGVGSGSLLSHINDILPEDSFYICVDHDINCLKSIKEYAEKNFKFKNFLFINADFLNIPIKRVDIIFDYLGSVNYNFRNEGFLIDLLRDKLKNRGKWIGNYFYFKRNCKTLMKFNEEYRRYFYYENIKSAGNKHFKTLYFEDLAQAQKAGIYESFLVEGDTVNLAGYYGEKTWG